MKNKWKQKASKVLLKVGNVMHKKRWSHGYYRLAVLSMQKDSFEFLGTSF